MKFVKQPYNFQVDKICLSLNDVGQIRRHGNYLPNTIRCLICGPSNCGKTNLMIGLLLHEKGIHYHNLYIYSKTLFQPKYQFLFNVLKLVTEVNVHKYTENNEIDSPRDAEMDSVIVFDDVACENQTNIRDYFSMGRHKRIDCFYLNQTYSKIPKQLIRDNANLIILFRQDDVNLKHVYDEHVNTDMNWSQFREMCTQIWSKPYNYLVINKDCDKNHGRYRMNFDTFVLFDYIQHNI